MFRVSPLFVLLATTWSEALRHSLLCPILARVSLYLIRFTHASVRQRGRVRVETANCIAFSKLAEKQFAIFM